MSDAKTPEEIEAERIAAEEKAAALTLSHPPVPSDTQVRLPGELPEAQATARAKVLADLAKGG